MINSSIFARHLDELKKYIGYLKTLKKFPEKEVIGNWQVYGLVERYLQLAIECSLSLGEQIISNYGFRLPADYKDIIEILAENKVIPKKLAKDIEGMAGFRNILVHGYTKIDRTLVYKHLHEDLPKISRLAKHLAGFIKI